MSAREDAMRALEAPIGPEATVDYGPSPTTVVQSTRLPVDLFEELLAAAEQRGVKPGTLVKQFIEQGLRPAGGEFVQLDRLRAELDQAVQRARMNPPAAA